MSKRTGEFITLDELLGEIGVDAARWFFASRAASSGIDFDIELAKKQSSENPVYYVQYAHARIASILRKAAESGMAPPAADDPRLAELLAGILSGAPEAQLARQIVRLPEVVEDAAASEETHGITAYATELATTFHAFYRDARVVDAGRAGPLGGAPRPGRGHEDDPRQRARPARHLRPRIDVATAAGRGAPLRPCGGQHRPARRRRTGRAGPTPPAGRW